MTDSSLLRYFNLIKNVRNWPEYFRHKRQKEFTTVKFTTRGAPIHITIPTLELYLVFKEIFLTDFYSLESWIDKLPPQPVVVDVGANAGYFDLLVMSRRPDAHLLAFEPVERNVELFRETLRENPHVKMMPKVFHMAVTGSPVNEVVLYKEKDNENSVTASIFNDFETHNLKEVSVKAISLSQVFTENKLERIDFLKLDCEGSEYPIVYESPKGLWEKIRYIFMEVHDMDQGDRNFESMRRYIESQGYRTTHQAARNKCYAMQAVRV